MRNGFRLFLMAVGVAACVGAARAADPDVITFDTTDGVTLEGSFYKSDPQAPAKDRNATVLLLPDIGKDGGGRAKDKAWDDLARKLAADGYSVLSIDFRGFGNSHSVSKDIFWDPNKNIHNIEAMPQLAQKKPDTIDHKDFDGHSSTYYPYLVNDVVAAKSFLDRQTDRGVANSSNLVVIGAGEAATIGAEWMASQWHLQRLSGINKVTGKLTLDEPEGRDEAGGLWLSMKPHLGERGVSGNVRTWLMDAAGDKHVPQAFVYGDKDETSESLVKSAMQSITNKVRRDNPSLTGDNFKDAVAKVAVEGAVKDSKLSGSALLGEDKVMDAIVKRVGELIEKRGNKEPRSHALRPEDIYYWTFPNRQPLIAKTSGDQNIDIVPAKTFMLTTGGD